MGTRRKWTLLLIFICSSAGFIVCTFLHSSDSHVKTQPVKKPDKESTVHLAKASLQNEISARQVPVTHER